MSFASRPSVLHSFFYLYSFLLSTYSHFGFEILTSSDILLETFNSSLTSVTFRALGQKFKLSLCGDANVLHPQAVAKLVDGHHAETNIPIHRDTIFSGIANNMADHRVNAAKVNEVWIIHIRSSNNLVSVEPLRWYRPGSDRKSMVVYKGFNQPDWNFALHQHSSVSGGEAKTFAQSKFPLHENKVNDLFTRRQRKSARNTRGNFHKLHGHKYDLEKPNHIENVFFNNTLHGNSSFPKRMRRSSDSASPSPTECDLMSIVDFNLYKQLGSDPQLVISALIIAYKHVDEIFRKTKFGDVTNCGIVIKEFRIYSNYTYENQHFNSRNTNNVMDSGVFLDIMRNSTGSSHFYNFCLVHLNCKKTFSKFESGMSYWAQVSDDHWSAGVCGVYYDENLTPSPSNLLVTTESSDLGIRLIDYALAIAHEIGHAWGSHHDNRTNGCHTGPHLMKSRALPGNFIHTAKFSPCSVKSISALLEIRRKNCFQDSTASPSTCLSDLASARNSKTQTSDNTRRPETTEHTDNVDLCCTATQTTNVSSNAQLPCSLSNKDNCTVAPAGHPYGDVSY
ncbi:hypothetical protein RRG08_003369 [Elysia crispata]|uniref:Peptidase M12B domain-containing protein n=1 Tax=Elysia crispata TaxID=231223 RepID=A0AAE1DV58_9GAST|nr:hypothetical protein RRG08_003369 [Elysia crispata]